MQIAYFQWLPFLWEARVLWGDPYCLEFECNECIWFVPGTINDEGDSLL